MTQRPLAPLLSHGLRVVFVGTEPGPDSVRIGCYYANPSNSFWEDLNAAGFTPTRLAPCEFASLLDLRVGLDDVYRDPRGLRSRLADASPRAVCFNSKDALQRAAGVAITPPWDGANAADWISMGSAIVWAVPDSSPLARRYRDRRRFLLRELAERIAL
jgi:G:T/U-mismatch repair DNA glycosylase